jgi:hypothetical protein
MSRAIGDRTVLFWVQEGVGTLIEARTNPQPFEASQHSLTHRSNSPKWAIAQNFISSLENLHLGLIFIALNKKSFKTRPRTGSRLIALKIIRFDKEETHER